MSGAAQEHWEVPWAEGLDSGTWTPERASLAKAFVGAIRQTGSLMC